MEANSTKNQHFVSQAEQRLNAINPNAAVQNQKIYSFSLTDREAHEVALDSPKGKVISRNLTLNDLFSFDVVGDRTRLNFEELFGQYEGLLALRTVELLRKLQCGIADIKTEVIDLFAIKFMNFLRSPYSVRKVLNTIGGLLNFHPTDPDLLEQYKKVLAGKKPQQEYLCNQLGITPDEYRAWLSALFMALHRPQPEELNLMEGIIKGLFENPCMCINVYVHQYTNEQADKRCLLSDRGYSIPLPEEDSNVAFSFNLCSSAFITYTFVDIEKVTPSWVSPQLVELYKQQRNNVSVLHIENNLAALSSYNRNVVYQCSRTVFSSSQMIYGVNEV